MLRGRVQLLVLVVPCPVIRCTVINREWSGHRSGGGGVGGESGGGGGGSDKGVFPSL